MRVKWPECGSRGCSRRATYIEPAGVGWCADHRHSGLEFAAVRARRLADFCPIFLGLAETCDRWHP